MHDLYIHVTKQLGIEQYQHFTVKIKVSKTEYIKRLFTQTYSELNTDKVMIMFIHNMIDPSTIHTQV